MDLLGEFLRRKREEKGKTLEEVAEATKININYLQALEKDNFSSLPGEVFIKGFLRHYSRYLGIDEQEVLKKYEEEKGEVQAPSKLNTKFYVPEEEVKKITFKNWLIPAGIVILLFIIFVPRIKEKPPEPETLYTQETFQEQPTTQGIEQPSQEPLLDTAKPNLVRPKPPAHKGTGAVVEEKTIPASPEESLLVLNILAKETSWVLAYIDDNQIKDVLLQPGERISWKATKQFLLTLGNAGGVDLEFNGKPLEPFGPSGVVIKDILLSRSKIHGGQQVTEGGQTGVNN